MNIKLPTPLGEGQGVRLKNTIRKILPFSLVTTPTMAGNYVTIQKIINTRQPATIIKGLTRSDCWQWIMTTNNIDRLFSSLVITPTKAENQNPFAHERGAEVK